MSCPYLKEFWVKIKQILKKSNIENFVTLKHIVFGYKIFDKDYFDFNYFLTILGFSIYKAYYESEQKTKQVNIYYLFNNIFLFKMLVTIITSKAQATYEVFHINIFLYN
jgi:hypothetical protein